MYILLGLSLISFIWTWWAEVPVLFYASVVASIFSLSIVDINSMASKGGFYETSIRAMDDKTDCCLLHDLWSSPGTVRWSTILFRSLSSIAAISATVVSWTNRRKFLDGHYIVISAVWSAASIFWILSCVPIFICLIQCAASSRFKNVKSDLTSKQIMLRFRKVYALWFLHDIVLGIFWLYLSIMLYDLADDKDDSEWRTIFLSMFSWHILIVGIHELYFKTLFSLRHSRPEEMHSTPCCGPKQAKSIWSFLSIMSLVGMYAIVILRMQRGSLLLMGTESVVSPIVFSFSQLLLVVSKFYQGVPIDKKIGKTPTVTKTKLSNQFLDF